MNRLEQLYERLPVYLQNVACSAEGWRLQRRRFDQRFHRILADYRERATWPDEAIRQYQDGRVAELVQTAVRDVPFYAEWFRRNGVDARSIRSREDLQQLPILTKNDVQSAGASMFSAAIPISQTTMCHTSGTTGGGLRFPRAFDAEREQWAVWWRYRGWHGIQWGEWCAYFGGRSVVPASQSAPPYWRTNYPNHQVLFSTYHLSGKTVPAYVAKLRQLRPAWIHGYPSMIALLAGMMLDLRIELGYQPRWVTTGAENLLPTQAAVIERAWGVKPRQHYGMAEGIANFSECELGSLHVDEDYSAVEFVSVDGDPTAFRVVGTGFTNPAAPLIRYDVQDIATLSTRGCPCGRPGRIVQQVDGRAEDYVVLTSGALVGRLDHIFKDMTEVREAQIVQTQPGELVFRLVRSSGYGPAHEQQLRREIAQRVGPDERIRLEYVERLPRTASGKLRFVVSSVVSGKLGRPAGGVV